MADWGNELILKFLELYQNEPVIWDPMHDQRKDKKQLNEAWLRLSESLQRPVPELKKKKESLMATFRGHLRRKKASISSGAGPNEIYTPVWFAYEFMESFLAPVVYACTTTINTQDLIEHSASFTENDEEDEGMITSDIPSISRPTVRRRIHPPELQVAGNQMKEAFDMLNNTITKRAHEKEEDECDLFGKILAKKLRKLPEHEREIFMYEIDGMFINRIRRNHPSTLNISYSNISSMDHWNPPTGSHTPLSNNSDSKEFTDCKSSVFNESYMKQ